MPVMGHRTEPRLRVLVAAETRDIAEDITRLSEGMAGIMAVDAMAGDVATLARLAADPPDLAILAFEGRRAFWRSAQRLAQGAEPQVELAFVGASSASAVEAFELDAVDFLTPPLTRDRLAQTVQRVRRRREARAARAAIGFAPAIDLRAAGRLRTVRVDDLRWIEAAGDRVRLHTAQGLVETRCTLGALAGQLDPRIMLRVSRSAVVNRAAIAAVRGHASRTLWLDIGGNAVKVGSTYVGAVREALDLRPRRLRKAEAAG